MERLFHVAHQTILLQTVDIPAHRAAAAFRPPGEIGDHPGASLDPAERGELQRGGNAREVFPILAGDDTSGRSRRAPIRQSLDLAASHEEAFDVSSLHHRLHRPLPIVGHSGSNRASTFSKLTKKPYRPTFVTVPPTAEAIASSRSGTNARKSANRLVRAHRTSTAIGIFAIRF